MPDDQPGAADSSQPKFQIRSLIWSVYAPSFLLTLGQGLLVPVLPLFARNELGSSDVLIAVLVSGRQLGMMTFDVPAGVLVGMFGMRRVMLAGILLFSAAGVMGGLSGNFGILMTARVLAGFSFALWSISRQVYIAHTVPVIGRGKALSLFGGISRVASIVGFFMGGVLYDVADFRAPFFAQAVVGILTAVLVLITFRNVIETNARNAKHNIFPALGHTLYDNRRIFATAGVAAIMLQFLRAAREYIIPLWVDNQELGGEGGGGTESGIIFGVMSTVDSVMFPLVGYIMDRFGRRYAGIPAYLILAAGFAIVPFADSFVLLLLVGVIIGLGNGLSSGLVLTMGVDFAPKETAGEFLGVWRFISDAGGASGPSVIGLIALAVTLGTASVLTAGIGAFGAFMLFAFVPETLVKATPPEPKPSGSG